MNAACIGHAANGSRRAPGAAFTRINPNCSHVARAMLFHRRKSVISVYRDVRNPLRAFARRHRGYFPNRRRVRTRPGVGAGRNRGAKYDRRCANGCKESLHNRARFGGKQPRTFRADQSVGGTFTKPITCSSGSAKNAMDGPPGTSYGPASLRPPRLSIVRKASSISVTPT